MKPLKFVLWFGFALALLTAPFVGVAKWNDWQLARLQNEIAVLPHPASSQLVARHGEIRNFGNGNHLDFWAVEVRALPNPRAITSAYGVARYGAARVRVPNSDNDGYDVKSRTQPVEVTILPSPLPANYHLEAGNASWDLKALAGRRGLYAVEVLNWGEEYAPSTYFDWRGN